jgi:hypothetical protein
MELAVNDVDHLLPLCKLCLYSSDRQFAVREVQSIVVLDVTGSFLYLNFNPMLNFKQLEACCYYSVSSEKAGAI